MRNKTILKGINYIENISPVCFSNFPIRYRRYLVLLEQKLAEKKRLLEAERAERIEDRDLKSMEKKERGMIDVFVLILHITP